ncbi:hypothetical protein TRIATDRAFT_159868 [Trichoderma atroviride IMI 206040]|uniref:Uncharacterized protein n=1 Tax=Hypocrea atroviridis (strain ATCC 20476 / IMI 206040) TaxID=452589 RepID=G9NR47_HYPAI|nr:uncharacterized protein TRIATDRAFT_159868 [Trichoderma atroviride IMI 206040]EHK47338.1 hypothetical protein TRIATDRAFT_159868 [Trichoderma atroviride IMI 206040]
MHHFLLLTAQAACMSRRCTTSCESTEHAIYGRGDMHMKGLKQISRWRHGVCMHACRHMNAAVWTRWAAISVSPRLCVGGSTQPWHGNCVTPASSLSLDMEIWARYGPDTDQSVWGFGAERW